MARRLPLTALQWSHPMTHRVRRPALRGRLAKHRLPAHTPSDKSDAEIEQIERRARQRERSDVGEAGTPSK
jgi:hypothetical protein